MKTEVSVVIPCYNLGRYLDEAVDSVLKQTMQDLEIIIVNDGSTDDYTNNLLADYRKQKTTIYTLPNVGPAAARNYGISKAKARYILPLDADDILEPPCLEKISRALETRPDVGAVAFWYRSFGMDNRDYTPESCTLEEVLVQKPLCGNSLFRKSVWEEIGGYDENFREGYEDWEFRIQILKRGYPIYFIREYLMRYRARPGSRNEESRSKERRKALMKQIIEKHEDIFREHAAAVLIDREGEISDLLDYQVDMKEALDYYRKRSEEHERYISELRAEIGIQERRIGVLTGKYLQLDRNYVEALSRQRCCDRLLQKKENELSLIYSSNMWRAGCALRDAIRSARAMALSPFRLVRKALRGHAGRQSGEAPPKDSR